MRMRVNKKWVCCKNHLYGAKKKTKRVKQQMTVMNVKTSCFKC